MAAAKRPMFKPARLTANKNSNAALTQKVIAAEAKVEMARAQANLVRPEFDRPIEAIAAAVIERNADSHR